MLLLLLMLLIIASQVNCRSLPLTNSPTEQQTVIFRINVDEIFRTYGHAQPFPGDLNLSRLLNAAI